MRKPHHPSFRSAPSFLAASSLQGENIMLDKLKKFEGQELCNILRGPLAAWLNGSIKEVCLTSIRYQFSVRKEMTDVRGILSRGVMISMNEIGIQLILKTINKQGQINDLSQRSLLPVHLGAKVIVQQKITASTEVFLQINTRVLNSNNTLASEIYSRVELTSTQPE